jgi:hypothetical protein
VRLLRFLTELLGPYTMPTETRPFDGEEVSLYSAADVKLFRVSHPRGSVSSFQENSAPLFPV